MAFRYKYKPKRNYPKVGAREFRILGASAAGLAMVITVIFIGPSIGDFVSGFTVASLPQESCVVVEESYTTTETEEVEYEYEVEDYIFENTANGPRAFIVLRNDGPSQGTFGILYTFSGAGRTVTQTQTQDIFANGREAFVFSLAGNEEMSGSFVVNAPEELRSVERQAFRNVTRCG